MRSTNRTAVGFLLFVSVTTAACGGVGSRGGTTDGVPAPRHLLIVLDGLRPDYVTPELMPNLYALGQRGVVMTRHLAVYPTVTQRADGVGAVFTRAASPGAHEGWVPGTLSFDLARWDHERSAQILYSPDWTDAVGEYGYAGSSAQAGVAGHGSSSPFDIHNTLVAVGPDLKAGVEIDVPSGNVDFAPTFLHLLGLDIPTSMQGRVLREALRGGPDPNTVAVESMETRVENRDGSYVLTAVSSIVDGRSYLDYTAVERGGQ